MMSANKGLKHEGQWRILTPSKATIWAALLLLIAPITVAISIRSELANDPGFPIFQSQGSLWGLALSFGAIALIVFLLIRMHRRKMRYNDQILIVGTKQHPWSDLKYAGFETSTTETFIIPNGLLRSAGKMDSSKLTLIFKPDKKILILPDIEGRNEFIDELKQISKKLNVRFTSFKKPK